MVQNAVEYAIVIVTNNYYDCKKGIAPIMQGVFIVMVIYFWMLSIIPVLTVACLCLVCCGIRRKPPLLLCKLWLWLSKEKRMALAKDHAPALYNQQIVVFSLCATILGVIFITPAPNSRKPSHV